VDLWDISSFVYPQQRQWCQRWGGDGGVAGAYIGICIGIPSVSGGRDG
jgi:hypothetical protein